MSRPGVPMGATGSTRLWLPMRNGSLSDWGPNAETVTATGSPQVVDGYFGTALEFGTSKRLQVATPSAGLDIAADITIDLWAYSTDEANERIAISRSGAWSLALSSSTLTWTVTDSGAATYTMTLANELPYGAAERWNHIRVWYEAGVGMGAIVNGNPCGFTPTVGADIATPATAIEIGGRSSPASTWSGRIGDVMIRAEADTDPQTTAPNLRIERFTEREFRAFEFDLQEDLAGEVWTLSIGSYYADLGFTLGGLIHAPEDIISVVGRTAAGVDTTFEDVGRKADLAAGKYCLDTTTGSSIGDVTANRLWLGTNPATFAQVWVNVRVRLADGIGVAREGRNYAAALVSSDPGQREFAPWNRPIPVGGGAPVSIAARHPAIPDDVASREASDVRWDGAASRAYLIGDHLPWSAALQQHAGFVEAEPADDGTVITAMVRHEADRLYRLPVEDHIADEATYPDVSPLDSGWAFPRIVGTGHRFVRAIKTDMINHVWKIAHPANTDYPTRGLAYLKVLNGGFWPIHVQDIDLIAGTFVAAYPPDAQLWCDVAGVGTPADATSTPGEDVYAWGDPADADTDVVSQVQTLLQDLYGVYGPYLSFGATWASTQGRVGVWLRYSEVLDSPDSAVKLLRDICRDGQVFYYVTAAGVHELEDVVKADAVQWTITDADVLSENYTADDSQMSRRMHAGAYSYDAWEPDDYARYPVLGRWTARDLYERAPLPSGGGTDATWEPPDGGLVKVHNVATLDSLLATWEPHVAEAQRFVEFELPARYANVEQFDVLDIQTTRLPAAAGSRWRVFRVHPTAGRVVISAFPESSFPATGTSTAGDRYAVKPVIRFQRADVDAPTLADTAGAWAAVADNCIGWIDDWSPIAPGSTHRWRMYAQRVGGLSDGDLVFRLRDITNGANLAASSGTSTSLTWQTVVTSFIVPSTDIRFRLEYKTTNGATGKWSHCIWHMAEDAASIDLADPMTPDVQADAATDAGLTISAAAADWTYITDANKLMFVGTGDKYFPYGAKWRCLIDADLNGATGFYIQPSPYDDSVQITGVGRYSIEVSGYPGHQREPFSNPPLPRYKLTSGSPKLHGIHYETVYPYDEVGSGAARMYTLGAWTRKPADGDWDTTTGDFTGYVSDWGCTWPGTEFVDDPSTYLGIAVCAQAEQLPDFDAPNITVTIWDMDANAAVQSAQLFGRQTYAYYEQPLSAGPMPATETRMRVKVSYDFAPAELPWNDDGRGRVVSVYWWVFRKANHWFS